MKNKDSLDAFSPSRNLNSKELFEARAPIFIWVLLTYVATILIQTLVQPMVLNTLLFTGLISLHFILYSFVNFLKTSKPWVYIVVQGGLAFVCAITMPDGFPAILVGLYSLLIGQSLGIYYQISKVLLVSIFSILMTCFTTIFLERTEILLTLLIIIIPMIISIVGYADMFFRQVHARVRIQTSLYELELAHQRVEELTLANERQRMARDLHDTLAQGLAGLILQLEAINAHLNNGNVKRGQEIVQQAMERAREALADARHAIDDLRAKSGLDMDYTENIQAEVYRFTSATGIPCSLDMKIMSFLPALIIEHSQRIISECLTNIARHAQANQVQIIIKEEINDILYIDIKDDGVGFESTSIGKQVGHYGLIGMKERVRILKGTMEIHSQLQEGTHIQIEIPIQKGEKM